MNTLSRAAVGAAILFTLLATGPAAQQPAPGPAPATPGQTPAPPGRGGGMGNRFAGQPRINALIVSGGCCHDYPGEARILMDAVNRALPVDWTAVVQGGSGTRGSMPVYGSADWAKGFDIVIHNECLADVDDPAYIRKITAAHRNGPPAIVIHCAMHSYRAATFDDWREFLGVTSRRHTKPFNIPVKIAAADHAVMAGFQGGLGHAGRRALRHRQDLAQHDGIGHGRQPRGQEGIPADLGERIRRQDARVRDDARARRRYVGRSGVSGSAGSRIQVGRQPAIEQPPTPK